ncbi:MAG: hypothetical protein M3Y08_05220 [Fibrobacterota bacterium]|nr:hypothetical protein [Fibrobacterota bacterium]
MDKTLVALRRMGKGRFYLALGYLIWSLLPHFHIVNHSHAGGSHTHASFSADQVRLANQVVDNLDPAELASPESPGFGGEALPKASSRVIGPQGSPEDFATGLHALSSQNADAGRHGHFWEDPNLAGLVSGVSRVTFTVAPALIALTRYLAPTLRSLRSAPARGPPCFLPA